MGGSTFLQVFLYINIFIIGVLSATAIRHAYAHFKPHTHDAEKLHPPKPAGLPAVEKERMLEEARANFKTVLNHSVTEMQHSLDATTVQLNKELAQLGKQIVDSEMERYKAELEEFRKKADAIVSSAQTDMNKHEDDLKAKVTEEVATEKERLVTQIDTKLADAVASFLSETLQHNVDLGAQSAYLTSMLEEHKAELAKGITDEA